jgi:hypothetical protein
VTQQLPVCPICRLYVEALVTGSPFEAAGRAEGFCQHTRLERLHAARQEDAGHDTDVGRLGGRALPRAERRPGTATGTPPPTPTTPRRPEEGEPL